MRSNRVRGSRTRPVAVAVLGVVLAMGLGCGMEKLMPQGPADQAQVHLQAGKQLIEEGKADTALVELDRALALAPKLGPAHASRAVALAMLKRGKEAHEALERADDHADGDADELALGVARIRVAMLLAEKDWLEDAVDAFEDDQDAARALRSAELHTWMGRAYFQAGKLKKAGNVLEAGLAIDKDYAPAMTVLKDVNTAREALAGMPEEYLQVATTAEISRADVAAIFVAELKLDRLLDKQGFRPQPGFAAPEGRAASTVRREPWVDKVTDVDGHWAKPMIEKMVEYQVMEAIDGRFDPERKITKAEFAMFLDTIITKVTGEAATKGLGGDMIFSDVQPDHFASAAILLVTSRGFLAARPDGLFGIKDPVPGATALDSVRKIRGFFQSRYQW